MAINGCEISFCHKAKDNYIALKNTLKIMSQDKKIKVNLGTNFYGFEAFSGQQSGGSRQRLNAMGIKRVCKVKC